jgi:hypothetical protein
MNLNIWCDSTNLIVLYHPVLLVDNIQMWTSNYIALNQYSAAFLAIGGMRTIEHNSV